eukprot:765979-Rhodomonas_salina.1
MARLLLLRSRIRVNERSMGGCDHPAAGRVPSFKSNSSPWYTLEKELPNISRIVEIGPRASAALHRIFLQTNGRMIKARARKKISSCTDPQHGPYPRAPPPPPLFCTRARGVFSAGNCVSHGLLQRERIARVRGGVVRWVVAVQASWGVI